MSAPARPGLDPHELVGAAPHRRGSTTFAGDSFRAGLSILTKGMETESRLSTIGRHVGR